MGDYRQSLLNPYHTSEAEGRGQKDDPLGLQNPVYEGLRRSTDLKYKDLDDGKLGFEDQEEETPPEEVTEEELTDAQEPGEAVERALEKDEEEGVTEMSRLSITQRFPSTFMGRGKKKKRRLLELAKPKANWQTLKNKMGCRCKGFVWISPCMTNLRFCVYWPSVYWTERFLEDTTLSITVPAVSRRVEELARPKKFYTDYCDSIRTTHNVPISQCTFDYQPSNRLRELATPKVRNNIWNIDMSEVSKVSKAAQMAIPSSRIVQLAKPKPPATLLEEWDPVPKPKRHALNYNRLLYLAMPKAQSDQCVPDRDPRWEVLDVTKKAVASARIRLLAKPKVRKELNEGYDRHPLAYMSSPPPKASPRKCD
ncbi:testicular haploid expressed gene protein isoform X1 [Myotis lucifugus]|uniref:testicular haploid expressed gene protein isoform X1 n=1 Tax=Myotis lucifugus TaxID=59463 RepID=UPI0006D728FA|nr:testicular haploid expressed gene protein isoform X1 [Myotis lucifugus]